MTAHRRRRRLTTSVVFLREVAGNSPVHRLWAGTKLLAVAGISVTLSFLPSWPSIAVAASLLLVTGMVARIPLGALPRFPRLFWLFMVLGAFLGLLAARPPYVAVAGIRIGLGALDLYARFGAVAVVLIGSSMMIGWTTPMGEIAPAMARLGWPLRKLRVPVDEWAAAVALCLRSLPLLIDELRILGAARRLRPRPHFGAESSGVQVVDELVDLVTAGLAVAMRRAGELGEAITARGGSTVLRSRAPAPGRSDIVALLVTAVVCAAAIALDAIS